MNSGQDSSLDAQARVLCIVIADIHRRGWCDGTGGNFSCVSNHNPLQLLMAPSGVDKGKLQPESLIQVDQQGQVIAGTGRASAETALHLTIVKTTGAGAVLHTHSQSATLLSRMACSNREQAPQDGSRMVGADQSVQQLRLEGLEMLKGLEGIQSHQQQISIPVLDNDQDLQRLSRQAMPHLQAAPYGLLIGGHGLYAWGNTLASAQRHLEILEFLLEQHWRQLLLESSMANAVRFKS